MVWTIQTMSRMMIVILIVILIVMMVMMMMMMMMTTTTTTTMRNMMIILRSYASMFFIQTSYISLYHSIVQHHSHYTQGFSFLSVSSCLTMFGHYDSSFSSWSAAEKSFTGPSDPSWGRDWPVCSGQQNHIDVWQMYPYPYHPWDWHIHLYEWLICMANIRK